MENKHYMLDTNIASYMIKGRCLEIKTRIKAVPMANIGISSITQAELLRSVAKKPENKKLAMIVNQFLLRVEILPWDSDAAKAYAHFRTLCKKEGKSLRAMDMLIAAHSIASNSILVTNDKAFYQIKHLLTLEDWTQAVNH